MLQPFERFSLMHLKTVLGLKNFYLVTQTYHRGFDHLGDSNKTDLLVTDYADLGLAKIHYNAVRTDKSAAIIHLNNEKHVQKLTEMLEGSSGYNIFWAVVRSAKELEIRITRRYKENMWRYIKSRTNWKVSGDSPLRPSVQLTFGELFIVLKHGSQTLRIKFEEIEAI